MYDKINDAIDGVRANCNLYYYLSGVIIFHYSQMINEIILRKKPLVLEKVKK